MARVEIPEVVLSSAGVPVQGASVQVNFRAAGAATVYVAETGGSTLSNPLTTTAEGRIEGWLEEDSYDLVVSGTGITTYTQAFEACRGSNTPGKLGTTTGDLFYASATNTISRLAVGSAAQVLVGGTTPTWGVVPVGDQLPWLIDIDVFPTAISQTNWDTLQHDTLATYAGFKQSSGAQNAEISWDVVLAAGTWTVELIYVKLSTSGIFSVQFDGVEKGTVDSYNSSSTYDNRSSVTGIVVSASGKVRLKLKMATKNGSSSNYFGLVQHVQLRRTA